MYVPIMYVPFLASVAFELSGIVTNLVTGMTFRTFVWYQIYLRCDNRQRRDPLSGCRTIGVDIHLSRTRLDRFSVTGKPQWRVKLLRSASFGGSSLECAPNHSLV
jgi:hypothetical protein